MNMKLQDSNPSMLKRNLAVNREEFLNLIRDICFVYTIPDDQIYSRRHAKYKDRPIDLGGAAAEFIDKNIRLPLDMLMYGQDTHNKEA